MRKYVKVERNLILFIGIVHSLLLSISIVFFITFMIAFYNNYQVLVTINSIGEAQVELFLLLFVFVSSIISQYFLIYVYRK